MLASYSSGDFGLRFASFTDEEHIRYVWNAMIEIHGVVAREQYTGKYNRRCWVLDPLESASWASPSIGQHKLYIPAYFKTENNVSECYPDYSVQQADVGADDICWGTYQVSHSAFRQNSHATCIGNHPTDSPQAIRTRGVSYKNHVCFRRTISLTFL